MIACRNIIKDNKERMKNMPRRIFRVIVIRLKFYAIKEWLQNLLTSVLKPSTFRMNMHMYLLRFPKGLKLMTKGPKAY